MCALRLRWIWLKWVAPEKLWMCLETPNDETDKTIFNAATKVSIGDGRKASF
jgi:hypothetical protein